MPEKCRVVQLRKDGPWHEMRGWWLSTFSIWCKGKSFFWCDTVATKRYGTVTCKRCLKMKDADDN